jgi:hypothetical protein
MPERQSYASRLFEEFTDPGAIRLFSLHIRSSGGIFGANFTRLPDGRMLAKILIGLDIQGALPNHHPLGRIMRSRITLPNEIAIRALPSMCWETQISGIDRPKVNNETIRQLQGFGGK